MTENEKDKRSLMAPLFVGGLFVLAIIGVVIVVTNSSSDGTSPEDDEQTSPVARSSDDVTPEDETSEDEREGEGGASSPRAARNDPERPAKAARRKRGRQVPFGVTLKAHELAKSARFNPPRPLRLLVRYGSGRSREAAHQRAEEAHQRFAAGEGSYPLIRELSDPPLGIPQELIEQYENLSPDQSSPVLEFEGGYVVFFGTPTERPTDI